MNNHVPCVEAVPAVSICMPAYNAGKHIEEALRSVAIQTFQDWELVVVEDGSSSPVKEQVESLAASVQQPVRYIAHDVNRGLAAARNTAAKAARGTYMAMLDADDYWAEDHLASVIQAINKAGASIGFGGSWLFEDGSGRITETRKPPSSAVDNMPLSLYQRTTIIQPSSAIINRAAFLEIGGSSEFFSHCEDLELWLRAAKHGLAFVYSGAETCYYRKHTAAMSAQGIKMAESLARVYALYSSWSVIEAEKRRSIAASAMLSAARMLWRSRLNKALYWSARAALTDPTVVPRQILSRPSGR